MVGDKDKDVWACQGCGYTVGELKQSLCSYCHRFFYPEEYTATARPSEDLIRQRDLMRLCPIPSDYYNDPANDMKKINPFADPAYGQAYLQRLDQVHTELAALFERLDALLKAVQRYEKHYKEVHKDDEPGQS